MAAKYFASKSVEGGWNPEGFREWLVTNFPVSFEPNAFDDDYIEMEEIEKRASEKVLDAFNLKIDQQSRALAAFKQATVNGNLVDPNSIILQVLRSILIRTVDRYWQEHLLHIDHLRTEVHLRTVGQKDPLIEFKQEAFVLFDALSVQIKLEIAHALFKFEIVHAKPPQPEAPAPQITSFRTSLAQMPEVVTPDETMV